MTIRTRFTSLIALAALAGSAAGTVACTPSRDQGASGADSASATSSAMPGMATHTGSNAVITEMRQHLEQMRTIPVDSLTGAVPMHRQMVANMISSFNTEMRDMNMPGDAAWQANVDSLRADLVHMPAMSSSELLNFLPAHSQRVTRLMQMHQAMMASMKM